MQQDSISDHGSYENVEQCQGGVASPPEFWGGCVAPQISSKV